MANIKPVAKKARTSKKTTRIIFVLDKSTSMGVVRQETIDGFNQFIAEQKKLKGKATFSFCTFDTFAKCHYRNIDIKSVEPLNLSTYVPSGWTALYDAVGDMISSHGIPHNGKTILVILTDGDENKSCRYTFSQIQSMITEAQNGGWEVMYLGSQLGARQTAVNMGIKANNIAAFDVGAKGMSDAIATASLGTSMYRGVTATYFAGGGGGGGGEQKLMSAATFNASELYDDTKAGITAVDLDDKTKP